MLFGRVRACVQRYIGAAYHGFAANILKISESVRWKRKELDKGKKGEKGNIFNRFNVLYNRVPPRLCMYCIHKYVMQAALGRSTF